MTPNADTNRFDGFDGRYTAQSVTVTICCALAIYNSIELLTLIFTSFRRYRGLYFWSLLIASFGILPYAIGFMIDYFRLTVQPVGGVISTIGWCMLITGQAFVLYSRLGVVLGPSHEKLLKGVKWMIIIDAIIFHGSTTVVMFGTYNAHPQIAGSFQDAYTYIEKIQMTGFTIQEFILSGLYVWKTIDILKTSEDWSRRGKRIMRELLLINVLIIFMDIALLVVEYQDRFQVERAIKEVVYSVKLKLEFAILSKLISITQRHDDTAIGTYDMEANGVREKPQADGDMVLAPFQSDEGAEKSKLSSGAMHVERADSWMSGATYQAERAMSGPLSLSATTSDQQRRRKTLEDDLYAGACRDVGG